VFNGTFSTNRLYRAIEVRSISRRAGGLTYFTKEATQTIHYFVQNCSRCIENYCFKHKNLVGCRGGGFAPDPRWGLCPRPPL